MNQNSPWALTAQKSTCSTRNEHRCCLQPVSFLGRPTWCPHDDQIARQPHLRRISEPFLCVQGFEFWDLFPALLNCFRLLLISAPNWTLRCQSQLRQQPTDRRLAQFNAKPIGDYLSDHLSRPQSIGEFHLQRVFHRNGAENPSQGRAIQLRRPSTPFMSIQRTPSTVTVFCQPTIHGCAGDTHCLGDKFRAMPFVHARYSPLSHCSQSLMVKLSSIGLSHTGKHTITA